VGVKGGKGGGGTGNAFGHHSKQILLGQGGERLGGHVMGTCALLNF